MVHSYVVIVFYLLGYEITGSSGFLLLFVFQTLVRWTELGIMTGLSRREGNEAVKIIMTVEIE